MAFPRGSDRKESTCNAGGSQVRSQGQEDPLEGGMATHSSILAWRIPWTEEPDRLQSMESQRVGYDWATFTLLQNMFQCIHVRSPLDLMRAGVLFGIPSAWNILETEKWLSEYLLSKWVNKWFEHYFLKTHRCIILRPSFFPPYACIHLSDLIKK